ncbi:CIS tube protein [Chryseobacterium sediminis]|uniref:LysM peptidoglycan-binding domain-containing protein n=1 Tax=Chryseobacterium sediminis TaxID=1679494 RepID=A0A5B2UB72_9FLAO|nr:LysM peptidoglycan-binding domain-containing protein [Chryseobacterium sediminis]KAA2223874.1 LysM peptidoglycan-binding domain-containing protein [Chryseobacterium sediminis]MBB6330958.1 LysM repeat protein [Chryseobacterium sediminis]
MRGAIQKLTIGTYKDSDYEKRIQNGAFKAFINPTGYSVTYKTELEPGSVPGTAKTDLKYVASPSTDLQLEFLFDGTGVTEANSGIKLINKIKGKAFKKTSVKDQVDAFYKATGQVSGPIHKPYNVILNWGDFEFKGVLAEFTVEYKLFDNEGQPLRAIGKAKFSESISPKLEAAQKKNESPDVTHKRTIQAGDTLPLMTESIYGDSKYYLEVAKINNLINFRQLKPGQELFFPPLEKVS